MSYSASQIKEMQLSANIAGKVLLTDMAWDDIYSTIRDSTKRLEEQKAYSIDFRVGKVLTLIDRILRNG